MSVFDFLRDNGLTKLADSAEEKMSNQAYSTGFISENVIGDILSEDPNLWGETDPDRIAFMLFMESEANAGIPFGTHDVSKVMRSEIERISSKEKISKEDAKKYLEEELKTYANSIALERGPERALDFVRVLKGKSKKIKLPTSIKAEKKVGFSFSIDLSEVKAFVDKISKVELLTQKDSKDIQNLVHTKEALSQIGQAVEDIIINEYLMDDKKLSKTRYGKQLIVERNLFTRYFSLLVESSTVILSALEVIDWFRERVITGSMNNELRQKLADLNLVERISDIIEQISQQFGKYQSSLTGLSLDVKALIDEARNYTIEKYTFQVINKYATSNLSVIREEIDRITFELENFILKLQRSSAESRNIVSGSSIFKGISKTIVMMKNLSSKITIFSNSSATENIEEIRFQAGVAKLQSAYNVEVLNKVGMVSFVFSVSDRVLTTLMGLGMDKDTAEMVKAVVSQYVYGRPGLIEEVDFLVTDRIVRNVEGAIV